MTGGFAGENRFKVEHSVRRRAKIICTIGPACNSETMLRDLMRLGMDVARLNFSHGSHQDHTRNIERLRSVAEKEGRTICILQDLQGPKIRTGRLRAHAADRPEERQPGENHSTRYSRHSCLDFHHISEPCPGSAPGSAHPA